MKSESNRDSSPRPSLDENASTSTTDTLLRKGSIASLFDEKRRQQWRKSRSTPVTILALLIVVYVGTTVLLGLEIARLRKQLNSSILSSPANEAVEWEVTHWPAGDGLQEPYIGEPRPELEAAWKGLLGNMNIRLSGEDLARYGRIEDAVALPDGSGYAGSLNVYHELHCVRWLHKYLYQEHYFPGLDDEQRRKNKVHSNHCLNTLKNFATCHGDVGLITYAWAANSSKPSAKATVHQCIKWDKLAQWTKERAFDMFKPGLLVHPKLGPAYPNGAEADTSMGH